MTKIVILGSTRHSPYEVIAPDPIDGATNDDQGYEIASRIFHPKIEAADIVLVWAPDGIGHHTQRDIDHAITHHKRVLVITPFLVYKIEAERYTR